MIHSGKLRLLAKSIVAILLSLGKNNEHHYSQYSWCVMILPLPASSSPRLLVTSLHLTQWFHLRLNPAHLFPTVYSSSSLRGELPDCSMPRLDFPAFLTLVPDYPEIDTLLVTPTCEFASPLLSTCSPETDILPVKLTCDPALPTLLLRSGGTINKGQPHKQPQGGFILALGRSFEWMPPISGHPPVSPMLASALSTPWVCWFFHWG
uniref:Uncharacterized protein n=1 Tax=Monopterus albus TaxID=43700 RepID=A0A3Q3K4V5_MONAL